jgi:ribonuclease D
MADGLDLKPLWDLLVDNEDVLKVFHAGGQDLEIVHNMTGKVPHPCSTRRSPPWRSAMASRSAIRT